jgi:hypothetical protein
MVSKQPDTRALRSATDFLEVIEARSQTSTEVSHGLIRDSLRYDRFQDSLTSLGWIPRRLQGWFR